MSLQNVYEHECHVIMTSDEMFIRNKFEQCL